MNAKPWTNEAGWDRALRIVLGAAMLGLGWGSVAPEPWDTALEVFGFVPLVTGLAGWCPIYSLLGLSSCPRPSRRS